MIGVAPRLPEDVVPEIHSTAYVDDRATLSPDVFVGPGCSIRGEVVLGAGTRLIGQVHLRGPMVMGTGNRVYPFACLGFAPQDRGFDPDHDGAGVLIGDDNTFREGTTLNRATGGTPTTVGNGNYFMAYSHVGHDCRVGNAGTFANNSMLAGHCLVGDRVNLAGGSGAAQYCRLGRLTMISGAAGVTRDLPPFCTVHMTKRVSSLNLIGLRRAGLRQHILPLQRAFDLYYRQGHTRLVAVEQIRDELGDDPLCQEFADFLATSKGVTAYGNRRRDSVDTDRG